MEKYQIMEKRSILLQRHWKTVLEILSPAPQMIIPAFDAFCENIAMIYEKCKELDSGTCGIHGDAGSEMEEKWGVSICTVDGQRFSIGDANEAFPVQSTRSVQYASNRAPLSTGSPSGTPARPFLSDPPG